MGDKKVVSLKREKLNILFDWVYLNHNNNSETELIELLISKETHGLKKSEVKTLFNSWAEENKQLPNFNTFNKTMRDRLFII